jgi:hypothetical protein
MQTIVFRRAALNAAWKRSVATQSLLIEGIESFMTALKFVPYGLAVSGNILFVTNDLGFTVDEYNGKRNTVTHPRRCKCLTAQG